MKLLPSDKVFCNSPWYELHIYWDGALSFCCHATPNVPYPITEKNKYNIRRMSIREWYSSEPMREARERMFSSDRWKFCQRCYYEEDVSTTSRRHRSNQKSVIFKQNFLESFEQSPGYSKFINKDFDGMPIDLHIDLGNYCNLACKMCNEFASSRIAAQYKIWKINDFTPVDWTNDQEAWDRFLTELVTIPKLQNIHFMGGETLIQPRFEECIDYLIAKDRTDVCISFVTNGTVYKEELINKLKLFPRAGIEVSIESTGQSNSYTRQGTKTEQVLANINRYIENNYDITLRPAPSLLTVGEYWQVIKLALDKKLLIKSNICTDPEFLNINVLPFEIRQTYKQNYQQLLIDYNLADDIHNDYNESDPNNYKQVAKNQILQTLSMLDQPVPNNQKVLLTQLCQHIQAWDHVYGYDAKIVYPELTELLLSYGYTV
jgi:organic radical activating enzyme